MKLLFQIIGLTGLLGLYLPVASAQTSGAQTSDAQTSSAQTSNVLPQVKALSSIRAFPTMTAQYLQPIPKPGGEQGRSISFRKVVLSADANKLSEMRCENRFRKPKLHRSYEFTSDIEPWFHPASLKAGFSNTLQQAGYHIVPREEPLFEEAPGEVGSLQIGARIKDLSGGVCIEKRLVYEFKGYEGRPEKVWLERVVDVIGELTVEWQVFDTAQSRVIFTTTTHGEHHEGDSLVASLSAAMHGSFVEASANLLADRGFYNLVYGDAGHVLEGVSDPIGLDTVLLDSGEPLKSKTASKSLVSIKIGKQEVEGFVLSSDGYVLTSATHLGGLREVDVKIGKSRKTVKGTVVRLAPTADVALIRVVSDQPLTPLPLRRAPAVIGEKVYILSNGRSTKRISGSLIEIEDGGPGHQVLIADMRHRNKAHGTPLVDINGNVLGMKIRDFLGEETTKKASRYLTIHDALQALRVHALG